MTSTKHLLLPSSLECPPRFATPRDLRRKTLGPAVGKVAKLLGRPLMPWQQYVADVVCEIDPSTGQFFYSEVNLTVPRQSGKTTLVLSSAVHRGTATSFFGARQHSQYTAQTRKDARKKFVEEFIPDIEGSTTFSRRCKGHTGNGDEHIRFANGSRFELESTTEKSGHGPVLDEAFLDEAFAQIDNRVEDGAGPAMITRRNTRFWALSTAGWLDASPYWYPKITVGREYVLSGEPGRLAFFEWSAPDGADPEDEAVWWGCMPALGITVDIVKIRDELAKAKRSGKLSTFRRPYLNQWVLKEQGDDSIVDMDLWAELVDPMVERPTQVAFGVAMSPDRRWTSISLAGVREDGHRYVQLVKSGRGSGWVKAELLRLQNTWKPAGIGIVGGSPAASLIPGLKSARVRHVTKISTTDFAGACGSFIDSIDEHTVHHDDGQALRLSLEIAQKRPVGKAWVLEAPSDGSADIAPLQAAVAADYVLAKRPKSSRAGGGRQAVVLS